MEVGEREKCRALVINNQNFEDESKKREGSEKDVEKLEKLFGFLKFKVDVHKDLSKDEIISKIQEFSENLGKDVDQCAVCIMSHGRKDIIEGSDGQTVDIESEILEHFTNKNCPQMISKLKLFLFQSCRGNNKDPGVELATDGAGKKMVAGTLSDAIIAFPTGPNQVAWRNKTEGSYYIQTVCEIFTEHAHEFHIQKLFQEVQKKLNEIGIGYKITQEIQDRGGKGDYFFQAFSKALDLKGVDKSADFKNGLEGEQEEGNELKSGGLDDQERDNQKEIRKNVEDLEEPGNFSDDVLEGEDPAGEGGTMGKENKRMEEEKGNEGPERMRKEVIQENMPSCQEEASTKYPKEIDKSPNDNMDFGTEEGTVEKENKKRKEENKYDDQETIKQENMKDLEVNGKLTDELQKGEEGTMEKEKGRADCQGKDKHPDELNKDNEINKETMKLRMTSQSVKEEQEKGDQEVEKESLKDLEDIGDSPEKQSGELKAREDVTMANKNKGVNETAQQVDYDSMRQEREEHINEFEGEQEEGNELKSGEMDDQKAIQVDVKDLGELGKSSDEVLEGEQTAGEVGTTGKEKKRFEDEKGQDGPERMKKEVFQGNMTALEDMEKMSDGESEGEQTASKEGTTERVNKNIKKDREQASQEEVIREKNNYSQEIEGTRKVGNDLEDKEIDKENGKLRMISQTEKEAKEKKELAGQEASKANLKDLKDIEKSPDKQPEGELKARKDYTIVNKNKKLKEETQKADPGRMKQEAIKEKINDSENIRTKEELEKTDNEGMGQKAIKEQMLNVLMGEGEHKMQNELEELEKEKETDHCKSDIKHGENEEVESKNKGKQKKESEDKKDQWFKWNNAENSICMILILFLVFGAFTVSIIVAWKNIDAQNIRFKELDLKMKNNQLENEKEIIRIKEEKEQAKQDKMVQERVTKEAIEDMTKVIETKNKMVLDLDTKIKSSQIESEKENIRITEENMRHQRIRDEAIKEKMKEDEKRVEQLRIQESKRSLKEEFSHWIAQDLTDTDYDIKNMKNVKEFHRCKSIENVDKDSFIDIVNNIAKVLHLSEDRREEIELASKADTMVNVLEDFEHGDSGKYSYGKYQTLKRANGNMDIVIALHSLTFELDIKQHEEIEEKIHENNQMMVLTMNSVITSNERTALKSKFRGQAMQLFESDCPNQLLTEMNIATQTEMRNEAKNRKSKEKEEEKRKKEANDFEDKIQQEREKNRLETEKLLKEQEIKKNEEIKHAEEVIENQNRILKESAKQKMELLESKNQLLIEYEEKRLEAVVLQEIKEKQFIENERIDAEEIQEIENGQVKEHANKELGVNENGPIELLVWLFCFVFVGFASLKMLSLK